MSVCMTSLQLQLSVGPIKGNIIEFFPTVVLTHNPNHPRSRFTTDTVSPINHRVEYYS